MAMFTTRESAHGSYDGRYLYLIVTESAVDNKNNKSTLSWTLYVTGGSASSYPTGPTTVKINGTRVYYKARVGANESIFPAISGSVSGTIEVPHESNGTKTVAVNFETVVWYGDWAVEDYGGEMSLTAIDRSSPAVSAQATVLSSTSLKIKGTTTKRCDKWKYSLDGGSTWTQYSTSAGTSAETTLIGVESRNYTGIKVRATRADNGVSGTSAAVSADLSLPLISFVASNYTVNSVYINASSSVSADNWQYSLDNGSTWSQLSSVAGTSASKTITGLSPNTTYQVKVKARKVSNGLYGTSSTTNINTLGASVLNSVNDFVVDVTSPSFGLNWTVYDRTYTHSLALKSGFDTIITLTGLTGSAGTNNKTISLTSAQRTSILAAMSAVKDLPVTYELTTYSGSMPIGVVSTAAATIMTTEELSKPTFTAFTHLDNNNTTVGITGDNQTYVQSKSSLAVSCSAATAKNGASIVKYRARIGEKSVESSNTSIAFGAIPSSGSLSLTVTAVDSRGYETDVSEIITVIEYESISIRSYAIRRENNADDTIQLAFSGSISPVSIDNEAKNVFIGARYRYKLSTDSSYGSYAAISGVETDASGFSFSNDAWLSLPAANAYNVQLEVSDRLSAYTVTLYVSKGQPLMSFREGKVGINTNDPQASLDVNGNIKMNGYGVMGYVSDLGNTGTDLDTLTGFGIWVQAVTANADTSLHYPVAKAGYLEVLTNSAGCVLQRYTDYDCTGVYLRYRYNDSWSAWKTISLS